MKKIVSNYSSEFRGVESVQAPQKTLPKGNVFFCEQSHYHWKQIPVSQELAGTI